MLENLRINNIAVIESADISFEDGLNVLTGETGAGKSIIIDAINAVLGERTSRDIIRTGCQKASVTALFTASNRAVTDALEEMGIEPEEDGSISVSRSISTDGKNNCRVNGVPVTVSMLRRLGPRLVNIHGQHDSQSLLDSDSHLGFIDAYAGNGDLLEKYQGVYDEWRECKKVLKSLLENDEDNDRRRELLEFQINEIESAELTVGEMEELKNKRDLLRNSEKIIAAVQNAQALIAGDEETLGARLEVAEAAEELQGVSEYYAELEETSGILEELSYQLEDAQERIASLLDLLDFDPDEAEYVEQRYDRLHKLSRKYGADEEAMLAYCKKASDELYLIDNSDEQINKLTEKEKQLKESVEKSAAALRRSRLAAAESFGRQVCEELSYLDMPSVRFVAECREKEPARDGCDTMEFLISANVGEEPKPLSRIASGGELSRIMLSIKNVLSGSDETGTLIFDEIDTGVSGRAAMKLGGKLLSVSKGRQVLCVTHLAQIAAKADHHFRISKDVEDGKTYTRVTPLDKDGRLRELSRLLSGDKVTHAQLELAKELLETDRY